MRESVLSSEQHPGNKGEYSDHDHYRHKNAGDLIHQFLHRRFTPLGFLHHLNDLRKYGVTSYLFSLETEASFLVYGTGKYFFTFLFFRGKGLTGDHALVHVRRSEEHTSELQSLMRISYAVFCLNKKTNQQQNCH